MGLHYAALALHLLALSLWLGHMIVWSLVTGPALKKLEPEATAEHLRERSLAMGGLGWPALVILVLTGLYLLDRRGLGPVSAMLGEGGMALQIKLLAVLGMILFQTVFGHRRAPLAIYANMALALVVLTSSVLFARGGF